MTPLATTGQIRVPGPGDKEGTHAAFSRCSCRRRAQGKDEEEAQIGPKRIRKAAKREILLCDFEGCGKIFSKRQYLNHHQKYQHVHQKTFTCPEPFCGKSFNFKKHLKEHQKLHSGEGDIPEGSQGIPEGSQGIPEGSQLLPGDLIPVPFPPQTSRI
ncbi:zinc finger protein 692-like [Pseudopipra pipra]|uniref:zinc finger protein 692-like n=1 Tax=Pseudopipra pipra TaxID=415032 RepID=UPI003138C1B2